MTDPLSSAETVDDFDSDFERNECDDCCAAIEDESFCTAEWRGLKLRQKQGLFRGIRELTRRYCFHHRIKNQETIIHHVWNEIARDDRYQSILLIIGMAILGEVVKFIVKRLLRRWFLGGIPQ